MCQRIATLGVDEVPCPEAGPGIVRAKVRVPCRLREGQARHWEGLLDWVWNVLVTVARSAEACAVQVVALLPERSRRATLYCKLRYEARMYHIAAAVLCLCCRCSVVVSSHARPCTASRAPLYGR